MYRKTQVEESKAGTLGTAFIRLLLTTFQSEVDLRQVEIEHGATVGLHLPLTSLIR